MKRRSIILDLAGGTGAWSQPWKSTFNVINVTLPEYDLTHEKTVEHFSNLPNVFGIFFACPCTIWSNSASTIFHSRPPSLIFHHFRIFMGGYRIIQSQKDKIAFWVIENPVGKMKYLLGPKQAWFHPYHYGDPYQKLTHLWGDFLMPNKLALMKLTKKTRGHTGFNKKYRAETRSITPAGFAQAFYNTNNPYARFKYLLASLHRLP